MIWILYTTAVLSSFDVLLLRSPPVRLVSSSHLATPAEKIETAARREAQKKHDFLE